MASLIWYHIHIYLYPYTQTVTQHAMLLEWMWGILGSDNMAVDCLVLVIINFDNCFFFPSRSPGLWLFSTGSSPCWMLWLKCIGSNSNYCCCRLTACSFHGFLDSQINFLIFLCKQNFGCAVNHAFQSNYCTWISPPPPNSWQKE